MNRDIQKLQLSNTEVVRKACCPCSLPEKRTTCLRTVWQVSVRGFFFVVPADKEVKQFCLTKIQKDQNMSC